MGGPVYLVIYLAISIAILVFCFVGFITVGQRKPAPPPDEGSLLVEDAPESSVAVEEIIVAEPQPDAPGQTAVIVEEAIIIEEPPGAPAVEEVEAPVKLPLRERLFKSRSGFGQALVGVFKRTQLTDQDWEDVEAILLQADVGISATTRIVEDLKDKARKVAPDELLSKLREELIAIIGAGERHLNTKDSGLTVWIVTGVNGTGKTTTIGKLALRLHREGKKVVLAAADTFRAAADEQLAIWASRSGASIVSHAPGADPAAVAFDGVKAAKEQSADVLIVDTAGRLHNKQGLMDELGKIVRVVEREAGKPDEVLLVLDATTGQNGVLQARAFTEAAGASSIALTKLDGTAKGGIVIAVQQELDLPVKLVGVGETPEDLRDFDPEQFVDALIGS